jgi:predicted ATPase
VFASAIDAVAGAVAAQRNLADVDWPDDRPVRVRMGIHTGSPRRHDDGYVGVDVHKAARIAACAHGGQIVVSDTTAPLARSGETGGLLPGVGFKDLGEHRVKDIDSPVRLFQLTAPGLAAEFGALRSLKGSTTLPTAWLPLIGRDGELLDLVEWLRTGEGRLLTLTGTGGSGKTRLAIGFAETVASEVPGGVSFVPLASAGTDEAMWSAISHVLGLPVDATVPPTLFDHVGASRAVWVLDNLEQLETAPRVVAEILDALPQVRVLATSRSPLHLSAEREYPLSPLTLPADMSQESIAASGAVQFFVQCASKVRRQFELTPEVAPDVANLCAALDGLPLALELTAARLKLFSVKQLLGRLDSVLDLASTRVDGEAADRQRTLRAAIEWSFRLLPPEQQALLPRLAVFAGGASLEGLAAVCEDLFGDDDESLVEAVLGLVDTSFVHVRYDTEPTRFTMLETVRRFGTQLLDALPVGEDVYRAHAQHFLNLSVALRDRVFEGDDIYRELAMDLDNFRSLVYRWVSGLADPLDRNVAVTPRQALSLVARLGMGVYFQDQIAQWLAYGLSKPGGDDDPAGSMICQAALTVNRSASGRFDEAISAAGEALRLYDELTTADEDVRYPTWLNFDLARLGTLEFAAVAHLKRGELDQASDMAQMVLDTPGVGPYDYEQAHGTLSDICVEKTQLSDARAHLSLMRASAVERGDDDDPLILYDLKMADIELRRGGLTAMRSHLRSAAERDATLDDPFRKPDVLDSVATAVAPSYPEGAARAMGAADDHRLTHGMPGRQLDSVGQVRVSAARAELGDARWNHWAAVGKREGWSLVLGELLENDELWAESQG